ncbi:MULTISPECIES: response regulator [Flavobacterium]|uniref:response regulator n=1 Tax=Flavobacterium TaxID=237 RepID=UPI002114EDA6|nr:MULTISPECIES: response regulator [Flavobacterium]UUF12552.1 response regulator [Flavobacterium panici]
MAADNDNAQKYIYLADDDSDDREFFADALSETAPDAVLEQAEDGMYLMYKLLALPSDELPDFIFLDINMPRKSGLECLEEIRSHSGWLKEVNIVMLSTSSDPDNVQKALELGAAFYAVKPSSFEYLKSLLRDILSLNFISALEKKRKFLLT